MPDTVENSAVSPTESCRAFLNRSYDGLKRLESFLSAAGEPSHVANKTFSRSVARSQMEKMRHFQGSPWMFIYKKKKKISLLIEWLDKRASGDMLKAIVGLPLVFQEFFSFFKQCCGSISQGQIKVGELVVAFTPAAQDWSWAKKKKNQRFCKDIHH